MTIKEIARLSGVGVSTVSRYLNNGYVSEEKKEVIAKVIEETNYTPNSAALTMRGKSNEIVIIVQRVSSNTTSRFLEGVINQCTLMGFNAVIHAVNFDKSKQEQYISSAIDRSVHGIIVFSFTESVEHEYDNLLIVGQKSSKYKSIYSDGKKIYKDLVSRVLEGKEVNKVYITGIDIMDIEFINRVAGAIEGAKSKDTEFEVIEQEFSSIRKGFTLKKNCYYVCLTDSQAYALIKLANEQNMIVGKDVFISGYGNYLTSSMLGLTTVDGLYETVGVQAVKSIVQRDNKSIEIYPQISLRQSTEYIQ